MGARRAEHAHYSRKCRVHCRAHIERLTSKASRIDADHLMSARSSSAHSRPAEVGQCILILVDPGRSPEAERAQRASFPMNARLAKLHYDGFLCEVDEI
jgi:hypothetical protein